MGIRKEIRYLQGMRVSSRQGYDNEVGSVEPFVLHEVRDKSNGLNGFSQAHLVRQDPVQVIVVKGNQPLQAFNLQTRKVGDTNWLPGCCRVSRSLWGCPPDTV